MAELRKTVSVQIGTQVPNPKLGLKLQVTANSKHSQELLHTLNGFSDTNCYFYVSIASSNPTQLKADFEEFLTTSVNMAKEMSPEVDQMVGTSVFEVVTSGNNVVAAINLKANAISKNYLELVEATAKSTIQHEAYFQLAILLDRSLNDLLNIQQTELDKINGQFSVELVSSKSDKYAIKNKIVELMDEDKSSLKNPEDKLAKLLFLMFDTATFIVKSDSETSLGVAVGSQLGTAKEQASGYIEMAKVMYSGNKEMVDSFPFIQAFFDAVEQNGDGHITLGVYHKLVSGEVDVFGNDLGHIYKRIVS